MGAFKSAVITNKGQALLAKAIAGTADLEFTKIAVSENVLSGDLASKTNIGTIKQSTKVASVIRQNTVNVKVSASFSNEKLTAGYYVRNIGLYAVDPTEGEILYSISVADEREATADWMPPFNGIGVSSLLVDLITAVSNASTVNVEVDPTALVTVTQLKELHDHLINDLRPVKEAQGMPITIRDSANEPFVEIKVLGKSTQEEDPSPKDPATIKSVGDNGSVELTVCGENLYDVTNQLTSQPMDGDWEVISVDNTLGSSTLYKVPNVLSTKVLKPSTKYTIVTEVKEWNGTGSFRPVTNITNSPKGQFAEGSEELVKSGTLISHLKTREDFTGCETMLRTALSVEAGKSVSFKFRISVVEHNESITANTFVYQPFKKQTLSLSVPNCLRGVKTTNTSLANYTDAEGNMWLCDEVDLHRGVYVKRVGSVVIDNTSSVTTEDLGDGWYRHCIVNRYGFNKISAVPKISNRYRYMASYSEKSPHFYVDTAIWIFNQLTRDEFIAELKENPVNIVGGLETYVETPLTKKELSEYRSLYSNNHVTNIVNNRDADMQVKYYNMTAEDILKPVKHRFNHVNTQLDTLKTFVGYDEEDIYGVEIDFVNRTFKRLAGAEELKAGDDFSNITPWGGRKRCNLTNDGVVLAYYGDEGYTETGVTDQVITVGGTEYPVGTHVQVMVEQPIFYIKAVPVKAENATSGRGKQYVKGRFYISTTPKTGFSIPRAFYDDNGIPQDKIYLSAYEGCIYDKSASTYMLADELVYRTADDAGFAEDMLSSIAGAKPASGANGNQLTITGVRKLCNNRGTGWQSHNIFAVSVTEWLFMIEYASLAPHVAIGKGVCLLPTPAEEVNNAVVTGATASIGNGSGIPVDGEDGKCSVTYRGEENLWGNIYTWLDCINILAKGINEIWVTEIGTTPAIGTTDGYECLDANFTHKEGYASAFGIDPLHPEILVPTASLGTNTFSNYVYQDYGYDGFLAIRFGGSFYGGSKGFCLRSSTTFVVYSDCGGRLLYVPHSKVK